MSKKKIIRKSNKPFTLNCTNQYNWGGDLVKGLGGSSLKNTFSGANMGSMLKGGLSTIGGTVGNLAGNAISGGLESGAGKTVGKIGGAVGGLVGKVSPIAGAAVSAATGIIGGVTNKLFGSKLNQEKINEVEASNNALNTAVVNPGDTNSIESQWGAQNFGETFSKSDIGKDGIFSNKAAKKYRSLKRQQESAQNKLLTAYEDAANNAEENMDLNAAANFAAYGGPLDSLDLGTGSIGYEIAKEALNIKAANTANQSKLTSLPNSFESPKLNTFADGGLLYNGAEWSNGITTINNGGTHEENPMEGVPMGVDNSGTPNLVEQGEVVFNDYVFSNRLIANDKLLEAVNLPKTYNNHSFAAIAEKLGKESKERPNDPISKRGLFSDMSKLQMAQEVIRQQNQMKQNKGKKYAHGGRLGILYDGDGPYSNFLDTEENPQTYWGFTGRPNNSLNTSIPLSPTREAEQTYDNKQAEYTPYWEAANQANYIGLPTPLWKGATNIGVSGAKQPIFIDASGTKVTNTPKSISSVDKNKNNKGTEFDPTWLRYAPVVGTAIGLGNDLFSKPDYSSANTVLNAANSVGNFTSVSADPISNYLQYKAFDRNYYTNKLAAQSGATRRAIMNSSSPSRTAALLAADYNAQGKLGDLARQAEEYNLAQRQAVETFNRGTNMTNSEMGLKAAMANQQAQLTAKNARLQGITQAMAMRDAIDARRGASLSANMSNLFNSLGDIGRENYTKNMIMSNPALYYSIGKNGQISYKNGYENLSEAEKNEIQAAANKAAKKKSKGGYLTIKKGGK